MSYTVIFERIIFFLTLFLFGLIFDYNLLFFFLFGSFPPAALNEQLVELNVQPQFVFISKVKTHA